MPLSASLAARMTRVSLAAISPATASAARRAGRAGHDLEHRAELHQVGGGDRAGGEVEGAHQVLRHQPRHVGGGAERALVDLGHAEVGVVAGDDAVGVADQADAAAEAEAVDRGDHRHRALVDGLEGGVAALVGADQGVEAGGVLHLLDVDAGVEAVALGAQHDHLGRRVARAASSRAAARSNQPCTGSALTGGCVHRDDADAVVAQLAGDGHGPPCRSNQPSICLVG